MPNRLLWPSERMTDQFDRASTLNFVTVARVRGRLSAELLAQALRKLELRHPLLRAGIDRRGKSPRFVEGAAAAIPLHEQEVEPARWQAVAESMLAHREWPDLGPRAELHWLKNSANTSTILLCFHHIVGDGHSGAVAMGDLLSFATDPTLAVERVESPGTGAFLPSNHRGVRATLRAVAMTVRAMRAAPIVVGQNYPVPPDQRRPHLHRFRLQQDLTETIARSARESRVTVHGMVCAAFGLAVRESFPHALKQRMLHPVCMRRYLRDLPSCAHPPRSAVGCYVSSVETDHRVLADRSLLDVAREVSDGIAKRKREGMPLLTSPLAGPFVTGLFSSRPAGDLREMAESKILNTLAVSNLGRLEALAVRKSFPELTVEDTFFVIAGSVLSALAASMSTFAGELSFQLSCVEPIVARPIAETICARTEALLRQHAAGLRTSAFHPEN
jgi:hypothetical protein